VRQRIIISGRGGQGVLTLTRVLAEAAMAAGHEVITTETHGMAQRGGAVLSTIKVGPFHGPLIAPGEAEVGLFLHADNLPMHGHYLRPGAAAIVNGVGCDIGVHPAISHFAPAREIHAAPPRMAGDVSSIGHRIAGDPAVGQQAINQIDAAAAIIVSGVSIGDREPGHRCAGRDIETAVGKRRVIGIHDRDRRPVHALNRHALDHGHHGSVTGRSRIAPAIIRPIGDPDHIVIGSHIHGGLNVGRRIRPAKIRRIVCAGQRDIVRRGCQRRLGYPQPDEHTDPSRH